MRVVSVKKVVLEKRVPVYDLTSPKHHNFVLACGAVVHNSAKLARFREFQEVLPLRGKFLNVEKADMTAALQSSAILDMLMAIGFDPSQSNPYENLRVAKIVYLTDSDIDGRHIETLGGTFFNKYMPDLVTKGLLYIATPFEFFVHLNDADTRKHSTKYLYATTRQELFDVLGETFGKDAGKYQSSMKHLKGLGECPVELLREMFFNNGTRRLIQIQAPTKQESAQISKLMGEDKAERKLLLGV